MTIRVGINGFGRIGRGFLRASLAQPEIEIVAINDLTSTATNAHLLKYDSTQGRLEREVNHTEDSISVGGHSIKVMTEREPANLPWGELDVDVVIESTGRFTSREAAAAHVTGGARRVIISSPASDVDATFVIGVNDDTYDPARHVVVSNASCTTNCFVPMVKVLDDAFGVHTGLMTTVHAYTNDQNLLDLPHSDLRRSRTTAGEVNEAFANAAKGPLGRVLVYTDEAIVSSDIVGTPASCTFDSQMTMVMPIDEHRSLVKVFGWYDNEWGYANRLVDLAVVMGA